MSEGGHRKLSKLRKFRRRTVDSTASIKLVQTVKENAIQSKMDPVDTSLHTATSTTIHRRRSQKRTADEDEIVSNDHKRRSYGSLRIERTEDFEETALDVLDSPVLLDVLVEEADSFGPLKEFNAKFGNSTINQRAPPKKARRRRSIAVSVIKSIPEGKEFPETPTKLDFAPICNFLTPETEDDDSCHDDADDGTKPEVTRVEVDDKSEEAEVDDSSWMTVFELFEGMERDSYPKMVPCPIQMADMPDTAGRVSERHRQILIEWLIEVASEEKFRRITFHLGISILDRYLYYRKNVPKGQLQTIGTACLFIAAKMEEVTPADLYRLVEFGDGAVSINDLIKVEHNIIQTLNWELNAVTPFNFLLLFLQAPEAIGNKTIFPEFNESLLCYASTLLDLTRLDAASYKFAFHTLAAAILIRLLEYVEYQCEIQREMNRNSNVKVDTKLIQTIITFILKFNNSSTLHNCCDVYVTAFVSTLMDDILKRVRKGERLNLPPAQLNQGCPKETARLQSNLGEQGSVRLLDDIQINTVKIFQAQQSENVDSLAELAVDLNIPIQFLKPSRHRSGPNAHRESTALPVEPISPP